MNGLATTTELYNKGLIWCNEYGNKSGRPLCTCVPRLEGILTKRGELGEEYACGRDFITVPAVYFVAHSFTTERVLSAAVPRSIQQMYRTNDFSVI